MKRFVALVILSGVLGLIFGIGLALTDTVGTYGITNHALNAGVYVGPCVLEIKGEPGVGCYV